MSAAPATLTARNDSKKDAATRDAEGQGVCRRILWECDKERGLRTRQRRRWQVQTAGDGCLHRRTSMTIGASRHARALRKRSIQWRRVGAGELALASDSELQIAPPPQVPTSIPTSLVAGFRWQPAHLTPCTCCSASSSQAHQDGFQYNRKCPLLPHDVNA